MFGHVPYVGFGAAHQQPRPSTCFDPAGRPTGTSLTTTDPKAVAVPDTTVAYYPFFNLAQATSSSAGSVSSQFDSFARTTSTTDVSGNTAVTTYDKASRPVTVDDGKGVTAYTYDNNTPATGPVEHRGVVTGIDTGATGGQPTTVTAAWDAAGVATAINYPNGVAAAVTVNAVGALTAKAYTTSNGDSLAAWSQQANTYSQVTASTGPGAAGARAQANVYDPAGRLTQVADTTASGLTRRDYSLSPGGNRLRRSEVGYHNLKITTNTFDTADRQTSTTITGTTPGSGAYTYDWFGRTTTVPAVDTANSQDLNLTYYSNDQVQAQTSGATTQTFTRDPLDRVSTWTTTSSGQTVEAFTNHYTGTGDSPAWMTTNHDGTWTRNSAGPDGALALIATANPASPSTGDLQLVNPHGDVTTTMPNIPNVTADKLAPFNDTDEYGITTTPNPPTDYGWEGAAQRSRHDQSGLILMGARQYNPNTGRFLTTDPIPGGNANAYTYPTDPINQQDLDGCARSPLKIKKMFWRGSWEVPLRWGNSRYDLKKSKFRGWGYKKLRDEHQYNVFIRGMIQVTLDTVTNSDGNKIEYLFNKKTGVYTNTAIYTLRNNIYCQPNLEFRVIVDWDPVGGAGLPKGILNAYFAARTQ